VTILLPIPTPPPSTDPCAPPAAASAAPSAPASLRHSVPASLPSPRSVSSYPSADLLLFFISVNLDIEALASRTDLPIVELLDWADSPPVRQKLETLARFRQERLAAAEAEGRIAAIAALTDLARTSEDPIERRRAASVLMRRGSTQGHATAGDPRATEVGSSGPSSVSSSRATGGSPASAPTSRPSPSHAITVSPSHSSPPHPIDPDDFLRIASSPGSLAPHIIDTLRAAAPSTTDAAAKVLYDYLDLPIKMYGNLRTRFRESLAASRIIEHVTHTPRLDPAHLSPAASDNSQSATTKVHFTPPTGGAATFTLHLTYKRSHPRIDPCWLLEDITRDSS
jgi:hypothetical protein